MASKNRRAIYPIHPIADLRYADLHALDAAPLPALTLSVIDTALRLAAQDLTFNKRKGPGIGDKHTHAYMRDLNKIIRERWSERVKVEHRIGDHLSSNIDYYIPEDSTALEIAMLARNPNTEVEKDIFKALIGQECGLGLERLVILGKCGTVERWRSPSGMATREFALRRLGLPVLVREFPA